MPKTYQDMEQVKKTLEIFRSENGLFELRTFLNGYPRSGYFRDTDCMLKTIGNSRETFYFVLNEINDECYKREQKEKMLSGEATKNDDITTRNWLLVDCDVQTPVKGISSTDAEKNLSLLKAREVYRFLRSNGFEDPVVADSGNGYHILCRIQFDTSRESTETAQNFLKALDMLFSDDRVQIDKSVYNAARVTKLYGTLMQKGNDEPDRPHRLSGTVHVPGEIKITGLSYVKRIADMLPKPEPRTYRNAHQGKQFDLRDFMRDNGIRVKHEGRYSDGTRFILEECVFDPSHKKKDAAVFLGNDGVIGYHCFHSSCSGYRWHDVRLKFEPNAYDDDSRANGYKYTKYDPIPNYRKRGYRPLDFDEIMRNAPKTEGTDEPEPIFYTSEMIRQEPDEPEEFVKTGIDALDGRLRGLAKGEVTMLLGESGAGKTSLISQLVIEAANQDYRTGYFSGELKRKRVYRWMVRQAAGKSHVRPTQYPNYYVPDAESEPKISQWLNDKMFLYNNNYGNKFEFLKENLGKIAKERKLDLIIIDNLMCLDISDLDERTNEAQTEFVTRLKRFAEANDVHVLFVAHQRKLDTVRLCGKYDNCGSSTLINYVDNQFIIYRANAMYMANKAREFKSNADVPEGAGSELRITKDREGGYENLFIPLWFENESKRFKNAPEEIKIYGWQDGTPNNIVEDGDAADDPDLPWDGF